jgi:hypothetical protein
MVVVFLVLLCVPRNTFAQDQEAPGFFRDVTKRVLLDPTTYAPAVIFYPSQYLDWVSSQPFFRNGYHEQNFDFTKSGRPNDVDFVRRR